MAVKYQVIKKGQPGVPGGGIQKFYAATVHSGIQDIDALTHSIEKISTVSGADIRAVIYALTDVISNQLAAGSIVRLGELGSFRISISSDGFADEKGVTVKAIKKARILFAPGNMLKTMIKTLAYTKV